jgi:hypothetical protein
MPASPANPQKPWPRPWQRHPVFRFFASLQLAMILLAVLIAASIAGTLYESGFDARVARAYIYDAGWFNLWLLLLSANLAAVAFSRLPWKKHHTGFLLTHLGIILLLAGAMIGKLWGIEGSITLFQGQPPASRLLIDSKQLTFKTGDGVRTVPFDIIRKPPSAENPWPLLTLPDGTRFEAVGFSKHLQTIREARPEPEGGPAIFIDLKNPATGAAVSGWLFCNDPKQSVLEMGGMAGITFRADPEPADAPKPKLPAVQVEESILAFEKRPGQQVSHVHTGMASGLKAELRLRDDGKRELLLVNGSQLARFDLEKSRGRALPVPGAGSLKVSVEEFWPDFTMQDGKPATRSLEPDNPAVLLRVTGLVPAPEPAGKDPNRLILWPRGDGIFGYALKAKGGRKDGTLKTGGPLPTGWSSWEAVITQSLPAAVPSTRFVPSDDAAQSLSGPLIRAVRGETVVEKWVPSGWQIRFAGPQPADVVYGYRTATLPFGMELEKFDVEMNPGTSTPASFRSHLRITGPDGTATGSCWMNHPMNYPDAWWRSATGLTYKMSQAGWDPQNLGQSSVQILRDPGWLFKWLGSLLICIGIYTLFYLRPHPKKAGTPSAGTMP